MSALEDQIRAAMFEHDHESPDLEWTEMRAATRRRSFGVLVAAAAAVGVIAATTFGIIGTSATYHPVITPSTTSSGRPAASTVSSRPPSATSLTPTSPTTTSLTPTSAETAIPVETNNSTHAALGSLADSVFVFTDSGQRPGFIDQFTTTDNGDQQAYRRSWTVDTDIETVLSWYKGKYPHPDGSSPLTSGTTALFITPPGLGGSPAFAMLRLVSLEVRLERISGTGTRIMVQAAGYPVGQRSADTLLPVTQIVSATVSTVDDSTRKPTATLPLTPSQLKYFADALNAASVMPDIISSSTAGGTTIILTFLSKTGQHYRATYDDAHRPGGTLLDFGAINSRRLDLPESFYQQLSLIAR